MSTVLHAIPEEELVAHPCKTRGCENEATGATRGIYANLCDGCREAKANRLRSAATVRGENSYEAKAKRLVAIGKTLDKALDHYTPAREEFRAAMEAWAHAVETLAG